jgi:hypothetical protein
MGDIQPIARRLAEALQTRIGTRGSRQKRKLATVWSNPAAFQDDSKYS